MFTQKWPGSR